MDKRHILNILQGENRKLSQLLDHARTLDRIDRALPGILGDEIAAKVRTAAASEGRLLLITPSAALATRLRMDAQTVLSRVNAQFDGAFERLDVRLGELPGPSRHRPEPKRRARRSRRGPGLSGPSNSED